MPAAALPGSLEGSPARVPSPGPSPEQRRFNLLILGLMVLLVAALAGGLALYTHIHDEHQAAARAKADVLQAYLNYYSALEQAYRELDPAPLRPFVTGAQLKNEEATLNQAIQTGYRFSATASHDPQVVVYTGGRLASVDDIIVRHTTPLARTTMAPVGQDVTDSIHQSFSLTNQGGRWLVASARTFGTGEFESGYSISYAAAPGAGRITATLRSKVMDAYLSFWNARIRDLSNSTPSAVETVELAPELASLQKYRQSYGSKSLMLHAALDHNIRFGKQNASVVWLYDTFAFSSSGFSRSSGKEIFSTPTQIIRQAFRLRRAGDTWRVEYDVIEQ